MNMRSRFLRISATLSLAVLALTFSVLMVRGDDVIIPLPDVTEADGRLGTAYTYYTSSGKQLPPYAYRAGSRWDRFDFSWNRIEYVQGTFSFAPHEYIVDLDIANNIDVIGILGSTAKWAMENCSVVNTKIDPKNLDAAPIGPLAAHEDFDWCPCPPVNLDLPWDHPDNYWGRFVYETVSYFKDKIYVWEIWNEPDWDVFWTGTPAQYAQLLKVGYQAVKAADHNATVLMGGLAYWFEPNFYGEVFDQLMLMDPYGIDTYFFDALSLHLYSDVYNISWVTNNIKNKMASSVGLHPIWLTEVGVPLWNERWNASEHKYVQGAPYPNSATIDEAAAFVIQSYAESRAVGIDKFIFFRMHDDAENMSETFGLMRNDLTLRPAYVAYQVTARYLQGENQISGPFTNDGVRRITYWGTPKGRIDVLWNTAGGDPVDYAHPAVLPSATLVDVRGITQTLTAVNGVYTLSLAAATANTGEDGKYIIGGLPLLLIQHDTGIPESALHLLPTTTYGAAVPLTWDISDAHSGPWYFEVDRAGSPSGPWITVLSWAETKNGITQTTTLVPDAGDWYFRSRARDNVGNWEEWAPAPEVTTTVNLSRTLALSLTTYVDGNSNNFKDMGEIPPTGTTTIALIASSGETVAWTTGNRWTFERSLREGAYILHIKSAGLLPDIMHLSIHAGKDILVVESERGLKPATDHVYAPLLLRK